MADMTGGGSMVTLSSLATVDEDVEAMQRINLIIKGDSVRACVCVLLSVGACLL